MWSVEFSSAAAKSFRKLDGSVQRSVKAKLDELSALIDPGALAKPLSHDLKGRYRLHMGPYRIIFKLEKHLLVILVVDIGKRESVYGS
jgi:mRNA-degrading endonuclease RelE of RelBE toxin-antitoxin system